MTSSTRCARCARPFTPVTAWQRFCSEECQRRAAMTRYDQQRRERIIREYLASTPQGTHENRKEKRP